MPRASTSASTSRFGDREGFTPRAAMTSSSVMARQGFGLSSSSGSDCTHTTASTIPLLSISTPIVVTIPVHWAPSTPGLSFAKAMCS